MLTVKAGMIKEEMNELVQMFIEEYASIDMFDDMSTEDFTMLQKSLSIMKHSLEFFTEEAEMLEAINRKLDKLLASN